MDTVIYKFNGFNGFIKKKWQVLNSRVILILIFFLLTVSNSHAATLFVDNSASGSNNGTSWADAYTDLQIAINAAAANSGGEVWVAAGRYSPTSWPNGEIDSATREIHFSLKNGVTVYGGFAGTETLLNKRDVDANKTILSGDIGTEGDDSDNCYHVFYHPEDTDLDATAVLDGFTISGGKADITDHPGSEHSYGGGMYNDKSSPMLTNCTFSGDFAGYDGGGIYKYFILTHAYQLYVH